MNVYVNGKRVHLDPAKSLGKGGEADVYDIGGGVALKLYKPPEHPDYLGLPEEQRAARERLDIHQEKLREFPLNLPLRVVTPEELVTDSHGRRILGYTMPLLKGAEVLLRYSDRGFRQTGVTPEDVLAIFRDLHQSVGGIHKRGVVIGDFNDLNVLVTGPQAFLIDADSFQFDRFLCNMFTTRFVDPLLCERNAPALTLCRPHTPESDWYAYAIMLMQCLLYVGPYGGVYKPADPKKLIPHDARPLKRITVFNSEVRYPKPAIHYGFLPDELLQCFHRVFEKDERGEFPARLLDGVRWTKCATCGAEHARPLCPNCAAAAPAAIKEVVRVRGNVTATRVFRTEGVILAAALRNGELNWLSHEGNQFKREDGTVVTHGALDPQLRYGLFGRATILAKGGQVVTLNPEPPLYLPLSKGEKTARQPPAQLAVDVFQTRPLFAVNEQHRYWVYNGQLLRDGLLGPEYIGDVLAGQTLFWAGPQFGFGFYRAGDVNVAFVFDAERRGIKDTLKLPVLRGHLVDCTCTFAESRCWFFAALKEGNRTTHRVWVIRADGGLEALAEGEAGDGSWLGSLRGKCAAANFLLCATDDGLVRMEPNGGGIVKTREFPDTEPFVDSSSQLFAGRRGLYVVEPHGIQVLTIS